MPSFLPARSPFARLLRAACLAAAVVVAATPLRAQCADGAPPPCRQASAVRAAPPTPTSVAVLPLENRSPDAADAYLAEEMTEEIGNRLTQLGRLQIKPRGLVAAQWRRTPDALDAVHRLNVAWWVHGSVRRSGTQLVVNVQLGRASTGAEVWGSRFLRGDADVFAVQAEVAESVAAVVGGRLSPGERATLARRPTRDNEAYRLYLYGNALMKRRTQQEVAQALTVYGQAVRRDSGFAAAWARISMARTTQSSWGWNVGLSRDSLLALASAATQRALALDSTTGDVWIAATSTANSAGELDVARTSCARSLRLDSLSADAWHICGTTYGAFGPYGLMMPAAAEPLFRRALALDPDYRNAWRHLAQLRRSEGRLAEAEALYDTTLAIAPWAPAYNERGYIRYLRGNVRGALADLAELDRLNGTTDTILRAFYAVGQGDSSGARSILQVLAERAAADPAGNGLLARWRAALGMRDEALTALENFRAAPNRREPRCAPATPCSASLDTWRALHDPAFLSLRNEPRFIRLMDETRPRVPWR